MSNNSPPSDSAELLLDKFQKVLDEWDQVGLSTKEIGDDEALKVIEMFQKAPELLDASITRSGLVKLADEGRFFSFLSKAAHRMSWGTSRNTLLGAIWARAYERSCGATKEQLLEGLVTDRDFFTPIYCVPEFIARVPIPSVVLAEWLIQIRNRLGNGMASGGLWGGIQTLADKHPQISLEVLQVWTAHRPTEEVTSMAVSLLGRLRSAHPGTTNTLDSQLLNHADDLLRVVFHRSWVLYDQQTVINPDEYERLVERMATGTPAETSEVLHFVRCTLPAHHRCDVSFQFGMRWLHANAPTQPDGSWAHWVINLAHSCDGRACSLQLPLCRDLIPQLMPIPAGHDGTWKELETLLVKLLSEHREAFDELLFEIARRDRKGLEERFGEYGGFHQLPALMQHHAPETTVVQALDSHDESVRHFGIRLFIHLGLDRLHSPVVEKWSEDWIAILICQVKRESFIDAGGLRFLMALDERVSKGSGNLQNFFVEELVWQMKNLPGACLEPAKTEAEKLPAESLLRRAVKEAEQYFEKLKLCYRSAINSMEVSGYRRAQRLENRKRSRQISESAEKGSLLLSMIATKSYTLYGGKHWQTYMAGNLGAPSQMQEFSHSIEFPRMFALDPDGNAQRYRQATHLMTELVTAEKKGGLANHDS
jgi:hypothetical protein